MMRSHIFQQEIATHPIIFAPHVIRQVAHVAAPEIAQRARVRLLAAVRRALVDGEIAVARRAKVALVAVKRPQAAVRGFVRDLIQWRPSRERRTDKNTIRVPTAGSGDPGLGKHREASNMCAERRMINELCRIPNSSNARK
jgi:hypothetical protein